MAEPTHHTSTTGAATKVVGKVDSYGILPEPTAEDRARGRFFTAASGQPPTDEQRAAVAEINEAVVKLAVLIERHTPRSRNQSLALTALEDVSMRANRSIFAMGPTA